MKVKKGIQGVQGVQGIQGVQGVRGKSAEEGNYINANTFEGFCHNQETLINILNHRMTSVENNMLIIKNDVSWTKKLLWAILGVGISSLGIVIIKSLIVI